MPPLDPNEIFYSPYQKALVVTIDILYQEDATIDVSLVTPNDSIIYDYENFISNCMQITQADLDSDALTATLSSEEHNDFVKVSEDGSASKSTSIHLNTISLVANVPVTLCYVIEYDQEFFDHVSNQMLSNLEMKFNNDIHFEITTVQ